MTTENRNGSLIDRRNWDASNHWYRQGNVIAWYDRYTKLWTVYAITADGMQAGPAQYHHNWQCLVSTQGDGAYPAPLFADY